MFIDSIHIERFAGLARKDYVFGRGVNIIEGDNESGKSTIAAFIRFMFYGFAARSGERARYLSLSHGTAAGTLSLHTERGAYRIERSVYPASDVRGEGGAPIYRETLQLIDLSANAVIHRGEQPGDVFFGVSSEVFASSAFVGQLNCSSVSGTSLREAIENILFSADEDISTQKALKRLDDARVFYMYKNKKGGRLYDLGCRRDEALLRLEAARENEKKLKELEKSIGELDEKKEENKRRADAFRRVTELHEEYLQISRSRNLDALRARETEENGKAEAMEKRLFRGNYIPDGSYVKRLRDLAAELRFAKLSKEEAEKQLRENDFNARRDNLQEDILQRLEEWGGPDGVRAAVGKHTQRRRVLTVFAVSFLMLTVFAAALTGFLFVFGSPYQYFFLLATALIAASALCFFSRRSRHNRILNDILGTFGCEIEEELDNLFEEHSVNEAKLKLHTDSRRALTEKISRASESIINASTAAAAELDRLQSPDSAHIAPSLLTEEQIETIANQVEAALVQIARHRTEADKYRAICETTAAQGTTPEDAELKLAQIRAQFGDTDPDTIDPVALRREIDFVHKANEGLTERIVMLKTSYAEINASYEDPAVLQHLVAELDTTIAQGSAKLAAIELATEKLNEASEALRGMVAPTLSEHAGRLLSALTDGKYAQVGLDHDLSIRYQSSQGLLPSDYMSTGTRDLAYIGLRFALVRTLYRKTPPPVLFDESFAMLDDGRLEKMLSLLFAEGQTDLQSFVFTCHRRERETAEQMGLCAVIHL